MMRRNESSHMKTNRIDHKGSQPQTIPLVCLAEHFLGDFFFRGVLLGAQVIREELSIGDQKRATKQRKMFA